MAGWAGVLGARLKPTATGQNACAPRHPCTARCWSCLSPLPLLPILKKHSLSYWRAVVTGGTRGLGKALARELLAQGDRVLITGTSQESVQRALSELAHEAGLPPPQQQQQGTAGTRSEGAHKEDMREQRVFGCVCDVSQPDEVRHLAAAAAAALGRVDVWVCNAGISGSFAPFLEAGDEVLARVVSTNLFGPLLCAREAASRMLTQPLGGHIFFVDGAGSDGFATPQYAAYGEQGQVGALRVRRRPLTRQQLARCPRAHASSPPCLPLPSRQPCYPLPVAAGRRHQGSCAAARAQPAG